MSCPVSLITPDAVTGPPPSEAMSAVNVKVSLPTFVGAAEAAPGRASISAAPAANGINAARNRIMFLLAHVLLDGLGVDADAAKSVSGSRSQAGIGLRI